MGFDRKQLSEIREIIQETIKEVLSDKKFLASLSLKVGEELKIPKNLDKKCKQYESQIVELQKENKTLATRLDNIDQHSKRNNIRVYGIPEEDSGRQEDILQAICKFTKMNITHEKVENAYRIGKSTQAGQRSILIKFKEHKYKEEVMQNRKVLKGTKIIISDDLTKTRHSILREAVNRLGSKNVYCLSGRIFFRKGSEKIPLDSLEDLGRYTDFE